MVAYGKDVVHELPCGLHAFIGESSPGILHVDVTPAGSRAEEELDQ